MKQEQVAEWIRAIGRDVGKLANSIAALANAMNAGCAGETRELALEPEPVVEKPSTDDILQEAISRAGLSWSDEECNVLSAGVMEGLNDEAIAQQIPGRAVGAVKHQRHKLGMAHHHSRIWTGDDKQAFIVLHRRGVAIEEIAKILDRTVKAIQDQVRKHERTHEDVAPVKPVDRF